MEILAMSGKERRRLELFGRVRDGEVTLVKASELLGLSYRQAKRSYGRYRVEGDRGVVHRLRGRTSNRGVDPAKKVRVLKLYREKYADAGVRISGEGRSRAGERRDVASVADRCRSVGLSSSPTGSSKVA
jgi:hypothetical protein